MNFTISIGAADLHQTDRWAGDVLRRTEQGLEDAIERGRNNAVLAALPLGSTCKGEELDRQEKTRIPRTEPTLENFYLPDYGTNNHSQLALCIGRANAVY